MKLAVLVLGVIVLAVAGVAAAASFFESKDGATVTQGLEPGQARAPSDGLGTVAAGNVVLLYSDERLTRGLRELAEEVSGPASDTLEAAGQAVLVRRRPNLTVPVTALTHTHRLEADGPADAELRLFVDYWLGQAP